MASSSSSSSTRRWKYDVFLSFRGPDIRKGIANEICNRLRKSGIITFMDDPDLRVGDTILPTLIKAIKESRFAIVILSQSYTSSVWCLEELREICLSMEDYRILPLFYHVDPTGVRYQKRSFEEAFSKHETSQRHESEKVNQWRAALSKVANISGWNTNDFKTHSELVDNIVESLRSKVPLDPIESTDDFQAFGATKEAMRKVMEALTDDKITVVGVHGMAGVGKTSMVRHVAEQACKNGTFNHRIMAVVSQNPDLKKIQGTLAEMLGFIFEEEAEIGRACRLMQRIRRGNRILIILDDIRERIDLSNIGIPSYDELQRCRSKVLLTTRTDIVCHDMKCQSIIFLRVLSEKDSLTLFMTKARMLSAWSDFCDVAKKVARACSGLPVALIAVAKALDGKCLDDWKEAARRLEASQSANLEYWEVVFNCIKLSYDYLDTDDARSCFLLCCLFPEDYDIQIEDLLKYGMGKGLFKESRTMQDARVTAHLVVKYLKDCSLLLETEQDRCVKMHGVIRDVARRISTSEFFVQAGCQLEEWPSISAVEGYSAISLIRNKICKLPEKLVCPKLLILFLQSNVWLHEIPDHFFESLNVLRVLDLSRTRISSLPTSFLILINLQTLYLDGCLSTIDNISILGKLKKLEILSMRELPLVELPKEIGDLSHLRMLDITGDYVDNVPSEVICNLNLLEELYMQCNFADWGSKFEGAGEKNIVVFDELTGLSKLNVLKVFVSDAKCLPRDVEDDPNWVNFDICIGRDPSIRKVSLVSSSSPAFTRALTLDTTINALPGWFINAVTMKAEKLQYIMCRGLNNILVEYDCGRLHALKYLSVIGPSENLKVLMNTVTQVQNEPVFLNLEELHLVQVDCLKELCVGELPQGSLCNLRLLKVKHCYELVDALLPSQLLQRLKNLEELICVEIDELEYVFGCEGLNLEQIILTELKKMRLENLGKLIKIWNGPAPCTILQNLHSLVVSGCLELKILFTADVAQCLLQLEDLSVESCPLLERAVEANKDTMDSKIVFPKLKNVALIKLPQLTRFYGNSESAIECPLLMSLNVERCPQFSTSDPLKVQLKLNHQQHLDNEQRRTQSELVDNIVESFRSKVPPDAIESTGDFQPYEATKEAMRKVMEALTNDKITAIGVYGMGGVGKTSMVRHVAAQACRNGTFNHWIMAVVSQNLDLEKVQDTLADLLGFELKVKTEAGRAAKLHEEIMRKEKLLIIVDDVWERTELSKIGIPTYNELQKCKSKVLLTTRRLNVCNAMKCHEKISLNVLSYQDSWTLFVRNAGTISSAFEKVARRVASECKGLPIALIAVARALGDEDQEEWEKAAKRLEQSQHVNPNYEEDEENAFRCIRLSYDYLKNEDHKSCFLLCCLFPEDDHIKIEDLFRYAIGKRLFQDAITMEVARGRLVTVVKYLKNCSLLLDSEEEGCVKMHDVIRDTAIQIAESEDGHRLFVKAGCGLKGWPRGGLHEGCTAISLMWNEIRKLPEEVLVCPNLQILLLNGNVELSEIPEKLIQNLKELRVLDLCNTSISVLPQSFSLLTNLQALYLDSCGKLVDISVVGKLKKLEILSMRDCPGGQLSREIGYLTNLKILDVNCSEVRERMVTIPSKVISKLQELEELYMVYCGFEEDGWCVAEVPRERTIIIRFDELAGLSNLKILQVGLSDESFNPKNVEVAPDWEYFCISVFGRCSTTQSEPSTYKQGDRNSRSLYLNGATISTLPDWFIKAVTEKTEKLEYDECRGLSDIVMEYDHGRLHKLKHLTVCGDPSDTYVLYLKELMNTTRRVETGPVFENLEELSLRWVTNLEELCVGELPPGSLSNLKLFQVFGCTNLGSVSKFVLRLPNLEKLVLRWMVKLEHVFRCEGDEPEQAKLREIRLMSLYALRSICSGPAPRAMFQSLKILTIYRCELLQSLFASDVAQCLVQLEDLLVEWCRLLERVMEAVNEEKTVLPKLKNLVLRKLPMLYGAIAAVDIECPSLERLMVKGCPKLLFSTSSDLFEAFKSRNQFSFSASTSDPVELDDPQLYRTLLDRASLL